MGSCCPIRMTTYTCIHTKKNTQTLVRRAERLCAEYFLVIFLIHSKAGCGWRAKASAERHGRFGTARDMRTVRMIVLEGAGGMLLLAHCICRICWRHRPTWPQKTRAYAKAHNKTSLKRDCINHSVLLFPQCCLYVVCTL